MTARAHHLPMIFAISTNLGGMGCILCDRLLYTFDMVGAVSMISPGQDYVWSFDEHGQSKKPALANVICEPCSQKPELEMLVAESFTDYWNNRKTHDRRN
jgi:hypothetical protein